MLFRSDQPGYCYAYLEDKEDAEEAVHELKGRKILGQKIVLELLEKENEQNTFDFPRSGNYHTQLVMS